MGFGRYFLFCFARACLDSRSSFALKSRLLMLLAGKFGISFLILDSIKP